MRDLRRKRHHRDRDLQWRTVVTAIGEAVLGLLTDEVVSFIF